MAFSQEDIETLRRAKQAGKTKEQALAELSISRGSSRQIQAEPDKQPISNRITGAMGLGGATDVFGKMLSRSFMGNALQTDEQAESAQINADVTGQPVMSQQDINRMGVEAPTGKQIAGAVAQTAVIPAGAVLTGGGSLAGQVAAGAGLGYIYDVGKDYAEGKEGAANFKPGGETLAGAVIPVALRGAGAAFRGAGTFLTKSAPAPGVSSGVTPTTPADVPPPGGSGGFATPLQRTAREYAINRPSRLVKRAGEAIQESRDLGKVYDTAPAPVRAAMDADLDMRLVNAVSDADDATKAGYKQIVEIAEEGSDKLGVKARPEIVAGDAAADQYGIINAKRKEVGGQIGEAIDNLPKATYQARPLYDEVDGLLKNNGITPTVTDKGVVLDFTGSNVPPKQRATIQALYDLLTETGDSITARQLYNKDRLLSQLQREARFDGVSDVMIKTPDGQDVDMFAALREVFSAELEAVAPSIRPLNREYAQLRGLQDDIESSIFKSGNYQGTRDLDPAEFAQTNLRRLFSDAQSAADYRKIYDNLDAYSRALGYEGARADDLAAFAVEMRKLYPDSVPPTSATSIFGSVADKVMNAVNLGKANVSDQQRALRGLLGVQEKYTPAKAATELFGNKSLGQRTKEALSDKRGAINPEPLKGGNPFESLDYNTLGTKGEQLVRKFLGHMDGTAKLPADEWKAVQADMLEVANKANFNSKGGSNKAIADEAAERYQKQITNYESN